MSKEDHEAFLRSPALAPPPGVTANLENPPNKFAHVFPPFLLVVVIVNLAFAIKAYAQLRVVRRMLAEDYLLGLGWAVFNFAHVPIDILLCYSGIGVHQWDMTMGQYSRHMFLWNGSTITFCIIVLLVKISILLQYIRIFVPTGSHNFTFWASHALIWANIVYSVPWTFINIFVCSPRKKFWDKSVEGGRCIDWIIVSVTGNALSVVSNILIFLVPQRVIFRLQSTRAKKIRMSALFIMGIVACFSSVMRLYYHAKLVKDRFDIPYKVDDLGFWAVTELTAGFLIACLPVGPMVFKNINQQAWAVRFRSSIQSLLRNQKVQTEDSYNNQNELPTTIGGGKHKHSVKQRNTDIEFEELVNKTDLSSVSNIA